MTPPTLEQRISIPSFACSGSVSRCFRITQRCKRRLARVLFAAAACTVLWANPVFAANPVQPTSFDGAGLPSEDVEQTQIKPQDLDAVRLEHEPLEVQLVDPASAETPMPCALRKLNGVQVAGGRDNTPRLEKLNLLASLPASDDANGVCCGFSPGDRVHDLSGSCGTVVCCDFSDLEYPVMVSWDGYTGGGGCEQCQYCDNGNCCQAPGSYSWPTCAQIEPGCGCNPVCGDDVCDCECGETVSTCPGDCVDVPCTDEIPVNVCPPDTYEMCVSTIIFCPCEPQCDWCWDGDCDPAWNGDGECDCGCQFCDIDCPEYPDCCIAGPSPAYVNCDIFPSSCGSCTEGWSELVGNEYIFCSTYTPGTCQGDVCTRLWIDWEEEDCDPEAWWRFVCECPHPPESPDGASSDRNNFCANDPGTIQLSVSGGSGDIVRWFDNYCGGRDIGTGNPLEIASPEDTTRYYARWENTCGASSCASVLVSVNPSVAADFDGDCDVDKDDLREFDKCANECIICDVNCDGVVNVLDLQYVKNNVFCTDETYKDCVVSDVNRDGDVNVIDLQDCKNVVFCADTSVSVLPGCEWADFDGDNDVDHNDFAVMQGCISGPGVPADQNCADFSPQIDTYSNSGCLPADARKDGYPWCGDDTFEMTAEARSLHVTHRNATYNCCPDDIRVELTVEGRTLHLREQEILTMPCLCLCCYDVETTVVGLSPGPYTVEYCWADNEVGPQCHTEDVSVP